MRTVLLCAMGSLAFAGCGDTGVPEIGPPPGVQVEPAVSGPLEGTAEEVFDREFLFVSASADSTILIPWFFRTRVRQDMTRREISAWLARAGSWEVLAREEFEGPTLRAPGRILPGERVRITVGAGDRIDALRLRDPARETETRIGDLLADWRRPGLDVVRLFEGRTHVPSSEIDGFVLEVTRRWASPEQAPGDWIFLHAGTVLQLFLEEAVPFATPRSPASYRGWSRLAFQSSQWDGLEVTWEAMRPFEPARRDIPGAWLIAGAGGLITGRLEAAGTHLSAGPGEGPILPVAGFFAVHGEVTVRGERFEVTGVVRHLQR